MVPKRETNINIINYYHAAFIVPMKRVYATVVCDVRLINCKISLRARCPDDTCTRLKLRLQTNALSYIKNSDTEALHI